MAAMLRREFRESYGCPCSGPVDGRVNPQMTNGVHTTIKDFTGASCGGCPWFVFNDPLVREVLAAWPFYKRGQLDVYNPDPSHRLVEGLRTFERAQDDCSAERSRLDAEAARNGRRAS